ncbi:MAG: type II secretion system F family protein [Rhodospirillaceae bacterium]|nr:type II secretion system F family protein [Rhodospirillaceae bacterium]
MQFDPLFLMAGGAALAAMLVIFTLAASIGSKQEKTFANRLSRVAGTPRQVSTGGADAINIRNTRDDSGIKILDNLIKNYLPRPAVLRERLISTGLKLSIGEYVLFSVFVAIIVGLSASFFLGRSPMISVLSGLGSGLMIPHMLVKKLIERRLKNFTAEFPQAIDLIVRGLKSGLPVPASIRTVAEEIKDPVGMEFGLISDRLRIGQPLEDALHATAKRVPTPEFHFFVTSLSIQRETGGNLAETLQNLSDILRQRRQMKQKIKAMSSEAKASAYILGSLPFLMFGIMLLLNKPYVMTLFYDPRGLLMLGFGITCLLVGIIVMAKMVKFEI